ncbi:MAG: MBOAT family protein, partial [Ruminococcus sp.]|nr:MBOAT family protein [Ruminococcus sp.]
MVFSSLLFLFLYLPIVLILYYICPRKWRNLLLFVVNLVFYGWGEPVYVTLMIFSTIVDYTCGWFINKYRETNKKKAKIFLCASVIINLSLLGFFKYAGFLADTLSYLPFLNIPSLKIPLPIGISFYTF